MDRTRRTALSVSRMAEFAASEGIRSDELSDCLDSLKRLIQHNGPEDVLRVETAGVFTALLNAIDAGYREPDYVPVNADGIDIQLSVQSLGCPADKVTSWAVEDAPQCLRDFLPLDEVRYIVVVPKGLGFDVRFRSVLYVAIDDGFIHFCNARDFNACAFTEGWGTDSGWR